MTTVRPLPQDEATPAQHTTIIKCVCKELGMNWWASPDMTRIAQYLNSTFNLNLDAELEPLTKKEAHRIITQLIAQ